MTKKMNGIVEKYDEKLNLIVWMFKNNFFTYEEAKVELKKEHKRFTELRTDMFFYNLISEKDFEETRHTSSDLYFEKFDELLEIKWESKTVETAEEETVEEVEEVEEVNNKNRYFVYVKKENSKRYQHTREAYYELEEAKKECRKYKDAYIQEVNEDGKTIKNIYNI